MDLWENNLIFVKITNTTEPWQDTYNYRQR